MKVECMVNKYAYIEHENIAPKLTEQGPTYYYRINNRINNHNETFCESNALFTILWEIRTNELLLIR